MKKCSQPGSDLVHLAIIVGAALVIGVYLIVTCVLIAPDGVFYIRRARELAGDAWGVAGRFPPGYSLLLLGTHKLASLFVSSDSVLLWVYASQAVTLLCRVLALVCLYFTGKLLTDARRSFWAVLMLTFLPYPADFGSVVLREWPYLLFVAVSFGLALWSLRRATWWVFALIGVATGMGYLIRPESAQLLIYAAIALIFSVRKQMMRPSKALAALMAMSFCFLAFATPYLLASGTIVPHQLRTVVQNRPPIITSVADRSASDRPLEFDAAVGELLELAVEASDPDDDTVTLSAEAVPLGARPVYRFEATAGGDCYLTISEREKNDLVVEYVPQVYTYEGIAFYAWADGGARASLRPVYGYWLSGPGRHLFTMDEGERNAVMEAAPADRWQRDRVAFYAFSPDDPPAEGLPVYRSQDGSGAPHWSVERPDSADPGAREIVWFAGGPEELPAGLELESATLRWRPGGDQRGRHDLNLIASDGSVQSSQLVRIRVGRAAGVSATEARPPTTAGPEPVGQAPEAPAAPPARRAGAWEALYEIGGAFAANVMYFLVVPLALGLYRFLKDKAGPGERALTAAVIIVNIGLMFVRYVWVQPGPNRRYCLVLVALAMFHVPKGAEIMAHWLHVALNFVRRGRVAYLSQRCWFYVLMALALGPMCLPKLITPVSADKISYRKAANWLRENTAGTDVVAAPDARINFYAERKGPRYEGPPDPRNADYIVTIVPKGGADSAPEDWQAVYAPAPARSEREKVVVYRTPRAGGGHVPQER